jgi:hypothetical protein
MLLPKDLTRGALTWYWKNPKRGYRGPRCVPSRGIRIRQTGMTFLTGGKILPARDYRDCANPQAEPLAQPQLDQCVPLSLLFLHSLVFFPHVVRLDTYFCIIFYQ